MWGLSLSTLQWLSGVAVWVTAIAGAIGISGALLSAIWSFRVADVIQQESKEKIALAEQRAAEANLRAAQIEESIAPRRLTKAKQSDIASQLKKFSGEPVSLWHGAGDKESETFAFEIAQSLHKTKWTVWAPAALMTLSAGGRLFDDSLSRMETGINISRPSTGVGREAGDSLLQILMALGFDVAMVPESRRSKNSGVTISVTVNARPEGPQGDAKLR